MVPDYNSHPWDPRNWHLIPAAHLWPCWGCHELQHLIGSYYFYCLLANHSALLSEIFALWFLIFVVCLLKTTLLSANQIQEIIILLTSVTVFFGSHLVRNHESQSRTTESQLPKKKNQGFLNWKCMSLYVTRQLIWRQTPKLFITVYWN